MTSSHEAAKLITGPVALNLYKWPQSQCPYKWITKYWWLLASLCFLEPSSDFYFYF